MSSIQDRRQMGWNEGIARWTGVVAFIVQVVFVIFKFGSIISSSMLSSIPMSNHRPKWQVLGGRHDGYREAFWVLYIRS